MVFLSFFVFFLFRVRCTYQSDRKYNNQFILLLKFKRLLCFCLEWHDFFVSEFSENSISVHQKKSKKYILLRDDHVFYYSKALYRKLSLTRHPQHPQTFHNKNRSSVTNNSNDTYLLVLYHTSIYTRAFSHRVEARPGSLFPRFGQEPSFWWSQPLGDAARRGNVETITARLLSILCLGESVVQHTRA